MAKIDKLLMQAQHLFEEGESALQTLLGDVQVKIASRKGILVATDQRLIFYSEKLTGHRFESFSYSQISSIEEGKNLLMGKHLSFVASDLTVNMTRISAGDVGTFVETVKARMTVPNSGQELSAKTERLLRQARDHFEEGESSLHTVLGAYETEFMGKDTVRTGIFVATDHRLVFFAKRMTGFDFESFPYSNISSIEMGKNLMGHYVSFFASGNSAKMKWINDGDVRAFVEGVKSRMGAPTTGETSSTAQVADPIGQLEQLGKLHAAGVLTDEEFSTKKAQILDRI